MNIDEVVKLVNDALKKRTDPTLGTELVVLAEGIRLRDDRWYVPVYPVNDVRRLYDYFDSLAMAMEELDDSGVKIQLLPAHAPEVVH